MSDEEEICIRERKGKQAEYHILKRGTQPLYSDFSVRSDNGNQYWVEIRSVNERINSCSCIDHQINRLGTCKHIEAVLTCLKQELGSRYAELVEKGNRHLEIYLKKNRQVGIYIQIPKQVKKAFKPTLDLFGANGQLIGDPIAFDLIKKQLMHTHRVRISRQIQPWLDKQRRQWDKKVAKQKFLSDVEVGKRSLECLTQPLFQYQQEGMLHLAFEERALLADDMGLGKTIQALAAAELLRKNGQIQSVLIVAPASLKAEWEEQIRAFTQGHSLMISGVKHKRMDCYRKDIEYHIAGYEQVRNDLRDIQAILAPDLIILDEAQRIKNWNTLTAQAIKQLKSPYAFVLTGTPLENRIEEIYSIVQFIDPEIFGSLAHFKQDFYNVDERGKILGMKNLDKLHRKLRTVMLRRLKAEVEDQLPERTIKHYFVAMTDRQKKLHDEHCRRVANIIRIARKRPLNKQELDDLQKNLACMRMVCDSAYILDSESKQSPKLDELLQILDDLLRIPDNKIIIFSEWERMLELIKEKLEQKNIEYSWHTGSVDLKTRRQAIDTFKKNSSCRIFLSTDSGSTGLNLQIANIVINVDLPWNPAKLEQRIARAWRKNQTKTVQVIHLVAENTIEHRMIDTLDQKRVLAQTVVDGTNDHQELQIPSGRADMVDRIKQLIEQDPEKSSKKALTAKELSATLLKTFPGQIDQIVLYEQPIQTLIAVTNDTQTKAQIRQKYGQEPLMRLIDKTTFDEIQQMMVLGILKAEPHGVILHQSSERQKTYQTELARQMKKAQNRLKSAGRLTQMANVLYTNGFQKEALVPAIEGLQTGLDAIKHIQCENTPAEGHLKHLTQLKNQTPTPRDIQAAAKYVEDEFESALEALALGMGKSVEH